MNTYKIRFTYNSEDNKIRVLSAEVFVESDTLAGAIELFDSDFVGCEVTHIERSD